MKRANHYEPDDSPGQQNGPAHDETYLDVWLCVDPSGI